MEDPAVGNERAAQLLRTLSVEELLVLHDVELPSAAGLDERIPIVTHVDDRLRLGVSLNDIAAELFGRAKLDHGRVVSLNDLFTSLASASVRPHRDFTSLRMAISCCAPLSWLLIMLSLPTATLMPHRICFCWMRSNASCFKSSCLAHRRRDSSARTSLSKHSCGGLYGEEHCMFPVSARVLDCTALGCPSSASGFPSSGFRVLLRIHDQEEIFHVALPRVPQDSASVGNILSDVFQDHHGNSRKRVCGGSAK